MELQLLGGTRNRMIAPQGQDVNNKKWNPNNRKPRNDLCRNFANHGECVYGDNCKFKHIRPGPNRPSLNPAHSNSGILPSPPPPPPQRPQYNSSH